MINPEYTGRLCDAVRGIDPEIFDSMDITLGFAMVFEKIAKEFKILTTQIGILEDRLDHLAKDQAELKSHNFKLLGPRNI